MSIRLIPLERLATFHADAGYFGDGSLALPSIAFASQIALGFYRPSASVIRATGNLRVLQIGLDDTDVSHPLWIAAGSNLSTARVLTLTTGDAARTITLSGNPTLADWFDQSVKIASTPTFASQILSGNWYQAVSTYHNWGTTLGTTGYGIFDDAGTMKFKNSGGAWTAFSTATSYWSTDTGRIFTATLADNIGIGFSSAFGTNAAKTLGFAQWTQPTTSPENIAQIGAADWGGVAGKTRLHTRTEEGQVDALATVNETAIFYGVTWDESADSYTRTGRTTGHKVAASLPESMLPIQRRMERVILTDAGAVAYALGASDSTKKIDGATASVLTGADGQVMVRIPKFWYRYLYVGTVHTWEVSPVAMSGFEAHPAFYKDGAWVDYRYIGAYEGSLYDVSITAYVDGLYQTAVSAVFDTTDDSITIATRSNWATNLTVGQKLVVTGTTNNNATLTVASLVSGTKITVSENLVDETAASTVIATQKDFTATTGDKLSSVSGKAAINYLTRANARAIALNRGAGWRQADYDLMSAIQLLFLTEYASFYSQSVLGTGITAVTDWPAYNDYNPIARVGNSNSIGNASGNTAGATSAATESTKYLSYRGIENWFGHLWKWVDGFNINGNIPYRTNVGTDFADDTTTNYTRLVNVLNDNVTLHNVSGYPATIQKLGNGFLPASVGASSSTKITDYYYQAAGWRVALFGGSSADGANAGGFYWNLDNASGNLDRNVVARLAF